MRKQSQNILSLFLILSLTLFLSLTSVANILQEDLATERFDIETFNRHKDRYTWLYTQQDGTRIRQMESHGDGYQVEITPVHSMYTKVKLFNYDGGLIQTWLRFDSFTIGTSKVYDGKGNFIKEYDHDQNFAFSIDDLIKKMQDDYGIDITDTRQTWRVGRWVDKVNGKSLPVYGVYVYFFHEGGTTTHRIMAYLFHGNTGELLYSIFSDIEGNPDIFTMYRQLLTKNGAEVD